jgi:hypothetical protein
MTCDPIGTYPGPTEPLFWPRGAAQVYLDWKRGGVSAAGEIGDPETARAVLLVLRSTLPKIASGSIPYRGAFFRFADLRDAIVATRKLAGESGDDPLLAAVVGGNVRVAGPVVPASPDASASRRKGIAIGLSLTAVGVAFLVAAAVVATRPRGRSRV